MARKKREITTLSELKTYIEGAVEFNPEDWAPSKEQWDMIVEMIMNIEEQPVVAAQAPLTPNPASTGHPPPSVQQGPTMLSEGPPAGQPAEFERIPAPAQDGALNPGAKPIAEVTGDVGPGAVEGTHSSGIKVKTPNVDTSDKPYSSGFL